MSANRVKGHTETYEVDYIVSEIYDKSTFVII